MWPLAMPIMAYLSVGAVRRSMTANKYQNVRAALCWSDEIAILGRSHNDANIICIPARFVSLDEAKIMVTKFINEPFEGGRHQNRVNKIPCA